MKKIFLLLIACFILDPAFAWASPFLICDPYPSTVTQPEGFSITMDGSAAVNSPAQSVTGGVRMHYDLAGISTGNHTVRIKAYKNDPVWGRLESPEAVFTFPKPGNPTSPTGISIEQ